MAKAFRNLITILLICLVATGISISTSPILNDSISTIAKHNETPQIWVTSNISDTLIYNPKEITIAINSNSPVTLPINNQYLFNVIIYKEESIYKKMPLYKVNQEFSSINIDDNIPYIKKIDLSQSTLNLPNGEYKISISPNTDNETYNIKPLILHINYLANIPYTPATSNIPKGKMAVPLYFSDINNSIKQLIGITRFVDTNKGPLNTTISELQKGPKISTGLNTKSPIGKVEYVTTVDSITYINLSSEEEVYTLNPIESQIAMTS